MTQKNDLENKTGLPASGSTKTENDNNAEPSAHHTEGEPTRQEPPILNKPVTMDQPNNAETTTAQKKTTTKSTAAEKVRKKTKTSHSSKQAASNANNKPPKSGYAAAWFALLIALCTASGASYIYWDILQYRPLAQKQAQSASEQLVQLTLEQVRSQNSTIRDNITQLKESVTDQQQLIKDLSLRLSSARRQISEITHVSRQSWMLAEAEYLLRLANQRLMTEQATVSALALLRSADDILVDLDEVQLYSVRTLVASEIAALEALGEVDVEGHFLRLAALAEQIEKMSLLQSTIQPPPAMSDLNLDDQDYSEIINTLADKLIGLVRISQRDTPVKPLLSPQQHYYIQQNLRLMLEQAQLALLQHKPELYEQSLAKAGLWIKEYFQLNNSSGALLGALEQLRGINVAPQMPDISGSMRLLKEYLSNQTDRTARKPIPKKLAIPPTEKTSGELP